MDDKKYELPDLPYGYKDLEPFISEKLLKIHHDEHHAGYVNGANAILEKMEDGRVHGKNYPIKATLKALSFNIGGHVLHSIFWSSMAPKGKGGGEPGGKLSDAIEKEFESFKRFKEEFSEAAKSVEGSGWAALTYCKKTEKPIIMQIEKHNVNIYPTFEILLALDVWEHAYYLDYENNRGNFVDKFWDIVNWDNAEKRLNKLL